MFDGACAASDADGSRANDRKFFLADHSRSVFPSVYVAGVRASWDLLTWIRLVEFGEDRGGSVNRLVVEFLE